MAKCRTWLTNVLIVGEFFSICCVGRRYGQGCPYHFCKQLGCVVWAGMPIPPKWGAVP